mgnify:CR=1 FL=1
MTSVPEEFKPYLVPIFQRKAVSVTAVNVKDLTSYTDMILIVEAGSGRQVTTMAEHIIKALKAENLSVLGAEGVKEGEWALLDYGSIIIHVFETRAMAFYDLEGLWSDAPRFDLTPFESRRAGEDTHEP